MTAERVRRVQTFLNQIKCIRHFHGDVTARWFGHDLTAQVAGCEAPTLTAGWIPLVLSSRVAFSRLSSQLSALLRCLNYVQ